MEAKEYVEKLIEISSKKLALFDEILLFTKSQSEVINELRFEEMDQLLIERQNRMNAVDKLDEQFVVYSSGLKDITGITSFEQLPRANTPGISKLKGLVDSIQQKLAQIKEMDDENTKLIKTEMKNTQENISSNNAHKRATGAYYPPSNATSYYFDKKK